MGTWGSLPPLAGSRLHAAFAAIETVEGEEIVNLEERERAVECLKRTRDGLLAAVKDLSDQQMKFKPSADRWSVVETLEHIGKSEDSVYKRVLRSMKHDPAPPADRNHAEIDEMLLKRIAAGARKIDAPTSLAPKGTSTPAEALSYFLQTRAQCIEFAGSTDGLRDHGFDSPFGMKLDAYQWMLFNAAHSERHTRQILDVKADPNFPAQ
jgi:hypothetical protein